MSSRRTLVAPPCATPAADSFVSSDRLLHGSEQGRRWAAPVDTWDAGRVPAFPPPAWARSSVAPPERGGETGCPSPVATVEASVAARFVPPIFSSSFWGARASSLFFTSLPVQASAPRPGQVNVIRENTEPLLSACRTHIIQTTGFLNRRFAALIPRINHH